MSIKETNLAFPQIAIVGNLANQEGGMSLRAYIAIHAPIAPMFNLERMTVSDLQQRVAIDTANRVYYADELIKALNELKAPNGN